MSVRISDSYAVVVMFSVCHTEKGMIGGLLKSTSILSLCAAAGIALAGVGVTPAKAADLGGDCCADLEERVATLEATTARKSNKLVSLTIGGQVSRGVLWYNDGSMTGARAADNIQSSSRMRMTGDAKIAPGWTAGYYLEIEYVSTGSFGTDQIDARRTLPVIDAGQQSYGAAQPNGHGNSPFSLGIRQSHWYLKNDQLGTLSVGRLNSATKDMAGIELGNIAIVANSDLRIIGGEMFMRRKGTTGREGLCANGLGCTSTVRWTANSGGFGDNFRIDGVRYDSPTIMGFTLSAAAGDDYKYDVALRYAGEWNGLRVAAGVGYVVDMDEAAYGGEPGQIPLTGGSLSGAAGGPFALKSGKRQQEDFKINASAWHMQTGLFVSGAYWQKDFKGSGGSDVTNLAYCLDTAAGNGANTGCQKPTVNEWWVSGGIRKNFFGVGHTSIYGEYGKVTDGLTGQNLNFLGNPAAPVSSTGGVNMVVTDSTYTLWGAGIVQNIDKAAMTLYLGWQHRQADVSGAACANQTGAAVAAGAAAPACGSAANSAQGATKVKQELETLNTVYAGGTIRF
jgi:hypothetical protein